MSKNNGNAVIEIAHPDKPRNLKRNLIRFLGVSAKQVSVSHRRVNGSGSIGMEVTVPKSHTEKALRYLRERNLNPTMGAVVRL